MPRQKLLDALSSIVTPNFDAVWLGPFDQLVSAGYALLKSDELGYSKRDVSVYYFDVHAQIVSLLGEQAEGRPSSSPQALDNFLSSFYFNAGLQRLTFAAERLLTSFVAIPCCCGRDAEVQRDNRGRWPGLSSVLPKAEKRRKHLVENGHQSGSFTALSALIDALQGGIIRLLLLENTYRCYGTT